MRNIVAVIIVFVFGISASPPSKVISASAPVTDFVEGGDNSIIVSTMKGSVETYSLISGKLIVKYQFDKISDFTGESIDAEVFHLEKTGDDLLALVHGNNGKNDIYKIKNAVGHKVVDGSRIGSVIMDFAMVDTGRILMALLSNEMVLYDYKKQKQIYRIQISPYAFSAMQVYGLYVYTADESGEIHKINIAKGSIIRTYKGMNVDNVLCVAASGSYVAGGGKDRRVSIYSASGNKSSFIGTDYFVTAIAINDNDLLAWFNDNDNSIVVYSVKANKKLKSLKGHLSTVNKIGFTGDDKLITCGNDSKVIIWKL